MFQLALYLGFQSFDGFLGARLLLFLFRGERLCLICLALFDIRSEGELGFFEQMRNRVVLVYLRVVLHLLQILRQHRVLVLEELINVLLLCDLLAGIEFTALQIVN